jgi:deoxyribodipyrimidine photo-lyase
VVRRLASRDLWAANFERRMREAVVEAPKTLVSPEALRYEPGFRRLPDHNELGVAANTKIAPPGGESFACDTLQSFLYEGGREYRSHMSSPVTADSSSRLSPYLAFGNTSIKQTVQAANLRQKELNQVPQPDRLWLDSIKSFQSRLRWHCHFMQKLEDEPSIEFRNMSSVYDDIREEFDQELFEAWCLGMTGYPMVDACMRALKATGWINFRMRAMLVSFSSYHLWLHWRPAAVYLARHFLDFEPGIHFSQIQMQSGTTGINTIRIYSPAKQALDQDPPGDFYKTMGSGTIRSAGRVSGRTGEDTTAYSDGAAALSESTIPHQWWSIRRLTKEPEIPCLPCATAQLPGSMLRVSMKNTVAASALPMSAFGDS